MKKILLAISIVAGLVMALAIVSAVGADPPPDVRPPAPWPTVMPTSQITWSTPVVSLTLTAGASYTATVSFTSTVRVTDVTVAVAPNAPLQVKAIPASFASVEPSTPASLQLAVTVPSQLKGGRYGVTVYLRTARGALRQPLGIMVTVPRAPEDAPRIFWSTPVISQTLSPGATYTATVTFTSTRTITEAVVAVVPHAPLRVVTNPGSFATVQADTPTSLQIIISVPPQLRGGRYGVTVALRTGRPASGGLRQPLGIVVIVPKETVVPPRILWSTPVISQTLSPGATYTATVTFSSTRTITEATVGVAARGALQVAANPAAFARVEANTPTSLQVVVSVPAETRPGRYGAMVYIKIGQKVLQYGLGVHITVPGSSSTPGRPVDPPQKR